MVTVSVSFRPWHQIALIVLESKRARGSEPNCLLYTVMNKLDLSNAEERVLIDLRDYIAEVQRITASSVSTVEDGIGTLVQLRKTSYENLNQIQHEYAALCA